MSKQPSLSYKDAGVDIDAGEALVERIKGVAKRTARPEVLGGLGGFGALCEIPAGYKQPVLVSGTDGVGTKLRLALNLNKHDSIGQDLVAMCVNDLVVCGAEPLFFLDYYATGKLNVDVAATVVTGIGAGCELAGCSLVGGETAEMPGMYEGEDYDLAGFCVGVVEKSEIIDGSKVQAGDALIALPSSGPHSNGYSLIRKIIEVAGADIENTQLAGKPLTELLMAPTRIYVKPLLADQGYRGGQGHGPHHRRRPARQHPARAARRCPGGDRCRQLESPGGVRLVAGKGQRRRTRDAPRAQLRRRHGHLRGSGAGRVRPGQPARIR